MQPGAHLTNFVKKHCACLRLFKYSGFVCHCAGEGSSDVSKQFRFKQSFRERAAVDGNEWRQMSCAMHMNGPRYQFLAGP